MAEPTKTEQAKPDMKQLVKVKVLRAICVGGVRMAPAVSGKKLTATEAIITRGQAEAYGESFIEIVGDAPAGSKPGPVAAQ